VPGAEAAFLRRAFSIALHDLTPPTTSALLFLRSTKRFPLHAANQSRLKQMTGSRRHAAAAARLLQSRDLLRCTRDIPWRSASRSKKVPRSRDPLSRSFYFFLFYRTIPNRTTPCMRILSGRHLRGAFQHSRFRLHDNNVTRHSRWVVVRSTYHFAGGEGREGQTILSRSAKLPVGRLRTCGDRDCGAQAAARGGLRYYTAPSQRRMQYPHPRPRPLRPCASLSLFLSLSLSLSQVPPGGPPPTNTFARNRLFTPLAGILRHRNIRAACATAKCDTSRKTRLRDADSALLLFIIYYRKQSYSAVLRSNIRLVDLLLFFNSLKSTPDNVTLARKAI